MSSLMVALTSGQVEPTVVPTSAGESVMLTNYMKPKELFQCLSNGIIIRYLLETYLGA